MLPAAAAAAAAAGGEGWEWGTRTYVCVCVLQSRIRATVWIEAVDDHNAHHLKAVEFVR